MAHVHGSLLRLQHRTEIIRYARCDVVAPSSCEARRGNVAGDTCRVVSHRAGQATSVVLRPETQCRSFARHRNRVDELRNLAVSPRAQVLGQSSPLAELAQAERKKQVENIEHRCPSGERNEANDGIDGCEIFYSYTQRFRPVIFFNIDEFTILILCLTMWHLQETIFNTSFRVNTKNK